MSSAIPGDAAPQKTHDLPTPDNWPDRPLLLQSALSSSRGQVHRLNSAIPIYFDSDLFEGHAVLWAASLPSTPQHMFQGHKRKTSFVVQGKFKQPLPFDSVLSGQRFPGPLQHLPADWLTSMVLKLVHHINSSMVVGPVHAPSLLAPMVTMAQSMSVSQPGHEPCLMAVPAEDMRLLGPAFQTSSGDVLPAAERKQLMSNKNFCSQYSFDCDHVWTFHFWQHFLDVAECKVKLPLTTIDAAKYLGRMPISIQASTREGQDLWSWQLWHEKQFM